MKLHEISGGVPIFLTTEEDSFIKKHGEQIYLSSLDEHNSYLANNLIRKGIYDISKDRKIMNKKTSNE